MTAKIYKGLVCAAAILLLGICLYFGIISGKTIEADAAITPKYTVALSGTLTSGTWGGSRTTEVKDQTKISVRKNSTSGQMEDIILYLSGSSTSGTATLHNNNYINTSQLNFTTTVSNDKLTLTTAEGSEIATGTGSLSKTVLDGKYIIKLNHSKSGGAGYTQWSISVNVSCTFYVDTKSPTISGASTSTTGKYTNEPFTVSANDSGSGVNNLYMKAPNQSSYAAVGTSKTISRGSVNGRYSFYAEDKCKNRSSTYYVNFDDTMPKLDISGAEFGSIVGVGGFTVSVSDMNTATLYYKYETESWKAAGTRYTVSDTAKDGTYYFYAVDKLGNRSEEYGVRLVAATPEGRFVKSDTDNTVYFTWDVDYWTATLDGKAYTKGTWIKEEGNHTIIISNSMGKSTSYPFSIKHHYVKGETVPPTCIDQGYTEYKCSQCGDVKKEDIIDALGHCYKTSSTPPTCTEKGETIYTCEVCGFEYKEDDEYPSGHMYTTVIIKSPTCTESGERQHKCDKCGYEYAEAVSAMGHSYAIADEKKEEGNIIRIYTCSVCGDTYTQELGNQAESVADYIEYLFKMYRPYMIWVFLATAGVWSIFMGAMLILARKHDDKEKSKRMIINYIVGLVLIFGILVAAPYLVRGIAILVT